MPEITNLIRNCNSYLTKYILILLTVVKPEEPSKSRSTLYELCFIVGECSVMFASDIWAEHVTIQICRRWGSVAFERLKMSAGFVFTIEFRDRKGFGALFK